MTVEELATRMTKDLFEQIRKHPEFRERMMWIALNGTDPPPVDVATLERWIHETLDS